MPAAYVQDLSFCTGCCDVPTCTFCIIAGTVTTGLWYMLHLGDSCISCMTVLIELLVLGYLVNLRS